MEKRSSMQVRQLNKFSGDNLGLQNLYNLRIVNTGDFNVKINSTRMGDFNIPSQGEFVFDGHPSAPFDIDFIFEFDLAATKTDYLTLICTILNEQQQNTSGVGSNSCGCNGH
ncbi:MAG: hypothetical protein ACRBFS_24430 [Aureispira sp.]